MKSKYGMEIHITNMLSFNFNKKKEIGMKEVAVGNKLLIAAVV